jgi:hypothetical protein
VVLFFRARAPVLERLVAVRLLALRVRALVLVFAFGPWERERVRDAPPPLERLAVVPLFKPPLGRKVKDLFELRRDDWPARDLVFVAIKDLSFINTVFDLGLTGYRSGSL